MARSLRRRNESAKPDDRAAAGLRRQLRDANYIGDLRLGPVPPPASVSYFGISNAGYNGFACFGSTIKIAEVTDGLSNTVMVGEKSVSPDRYYTGLQNSDDQGPYIGFSYDLSRSTWNVPRPDTPGTVGQRFRQRSTPTAAFLSLAMDRRTYSVIPSTPPPSACSETARMANRSTRRNSRGKVV